MKGITKVMYNGEEIGRILRNHTMTEEEICDFAGIELARTQEDYENMLH